MLSCYVNLVILIIISSYYQMISIFTSAEIIYGIGSSSGQNSFYQIDSTTGVSTLLSTFTMPCGGFYIGKVAMSSTYAYTLSGGSCLVQISVNTGTVSSFSLSASLTALSLQDLQYSTTTNLLYVLTYSSAQAKNSLWSLDPSTMTTTLIATFSLPGGFTWVTNVGGYEYIGISGYIYAISLTTGALSQVTFSTSCSKASNDGSNKVYTISRLSPSSYIWVFDTSTNASPQNIITFTLGCGGSMSSFMASSQLSKIYIITSGGCVVTVDRTDGTVSYSAVNSDLSIIQAGALLPPIPSVSPSVSPSVLPSISPSVSPSISPSVSPSISPSVSPSLSPSSNPSLSPTSTCSLCPAGQVHSQVGKCICSPCPSGQYSNVNTQSTSCNLCLAGRYASNTIGAQSCHDCASGRYSPGGATICAMCPSGRYSASISGSSACLPCQPGLFSSSGASICMACPVYSNASVFQYCSPH